MIKQITALSTALLALFACSALACDAMDPTGTAPASVVASNKPDAPVVAEPVPRPPGAAAPEPGELLPTPPTPPVGADIAATRKALDDYKTCALECYADTSLKETDREGCKLTCRNLAQNAGIEPKSPADALLSRFDVCTSECHGDKRAKETDRTTCKLTCAGILENAELSPPTPAAPVETSVGATACSRDCLTASQTCERACDELKGKATDSETCRLNCGTNSQVCLDKCAEATP